LFFFEKYHVCHPTFTVDTIFIWLVF